MGERTPFTGTAHLNTAAIGATAGVDVSNNLVSTTHTPERVKIDFGPHLGTDFSSEAVGSSMAGLEFELQDFTQLEIYDYIANFDDKDLMELRIQTQPNAVIDTPTDTNMELRFQFYLPTAPTLASVMDEVVSWTLGGIKVQGWSIEKAAATKTFGTLV